VLNLARRWVKRKHARNRPHTHPDGSGHQASTDTTEQRFTKDGDEPVETQAHSLVLLGILAPSVHVEKQLVEFPSPQAFDAFAR
jgi:hypothetical protein